MRHRFGRTGYYYENSNLNGKNIILCSKYFTTGNSSFITSTIIDGSNEGESLLTSTRVKFHPVRLLDLRFSMEMPIRSQATYGGGELSIQMHRPGPECVIQKNYALGDGGGLACGLNSSAKVMNCTIKNNTADSFGSEYLWGLRCGC